jgi:hypothetical protein
MAARSTKLLVVWQLEQTVPSSPRWRSSWQDTQAGFASLKASDAWQARQVVEACAPVRAKPFFAWSNERLIRAGVQPSGAWQVLHSSLSSP